MTQEKMGLKDTNKENIKPEMEAAVSRGKNAKENGKGLAKEETRESQRIQREQRVLRKHHLNR